MIFFLQRIQLLLRKSSLNAHIYDNNNNDNNLYNIILFFSTIHKCEVDSFAIRSSKNDWNLFFLFFNPFSRLYYIYTYGHNPLSNDGKNYDLVMYRGTLYI